MSDARRWRRRAWMSAAGAVGLAGGWWAADRPSPRTPSSAGESPPAAANTSKSNADTEKLWSWTLPQPDGTPLAFAQWRASGLVLNFWATWCPPCLREFPQLERFHREMKPSGWHVVAVAVDQPGPVREFLARTPVSFSIGIGGFDALEMTKALGNTQGGLPFTVVFAPGGRLVRTIVGETNHEALLAIANGR